MPVWTETDYPGYDECTPCPLNTPFAFIVEAPLNAVEILELILLRPLEVHRGKAGIFLPRNIPLHQRPTVAGLYQERVVRFVLLSRHEFHYVSQVYDSYGFSVVDLSYLYVPLREPHYHLFYPGKVCGAMLSGFSHRGSLVFPDVSLNYAFALGILIRELGLQNNTRFARSWRDADVNPLPLSWSLYLEGKPGPANAYVMPKEI
jgi:hypothetical protein